MKLYQKLIVTTAVSTFFAVMEASALQAATITYDFKADVISGSLLGQTFAGFLSYDDSALTGVGAEALGVADELKVSFNFLGATYTEKNEVEFPDFPVTNLNNGVFEGLDFFVNDSPTIFGINLDEFSYRGETVGNVTYTRSQPVPEPGTMAGLVILGLGGLFLKKTRSKRCARA